MPHRHSQFQSTVVKFYYKNNSSEPLQDVLKDVLKDILKNTPENILKDVLEENHN
jgi:hypothetical protein